MSVRRPSGSSFVRRARVAAAATSGQTLVEMLVVVVILVIVVGALAQMFGSGLGAETDQSNRVQAQQDARVGLNQLERDLRCATSITASSTTLVTMTLPSYCSSSQATTLSSDTTIPIGTIPVASIAGFRNGTNTLSLVGSSLITCTGTQASPPAFIGCTGGTAGTFVSGTSITGAATWCLTGTNLVRYIGSGSCPASARVWVKSVISSPFSYVRMAAPNPPTAVSSPAGTLDPGSYYYEVTPITAAGEVAGTVSSAVAISSGSGSQTAHITWTAYAGATGYNVYGRDNGSTNPRMTPAPEAPQGLRLLTSTPLASTVFAFDDTNSVDTATVTAAPPLATVGVNLVVDKTPGDLKQRFTLRDTVTLRNSGRF
jgi:type II secretory pathway pseudopilin PulG